MRQIDVPKIIDYLDGQIPSLWWRITFGKPINEPTGIYVTIFILSEARAHANKGTLLEFSFIGHDESVTFTDLMDFKTQVSDLLTGNKDLSGFYVYGCNEDWSFINWYDDKNRKVIKQSYRFYFIK